MNISKKLGVAAASLAVLASVAPSANAQTVQELMAQIQALQAQLSSISGTTTTAPASTNFTLDLTVGSKGDEVKALQVFLNSNGFVVATTGAGSVGNETTYFGNATKAALAKYQASKGITPSSGYFGPKTRAVVNATVSTTTPTTPTTPVVTTSPLSIAIASDTAASANVQKGSANNQVLKFTLTGAADKATTITGLTLKSYGTTIATDTTDIAAVKLFDENGIQIGNDRTPAGNQINFVIVPALTIPANGSRTITVTTNVGSSANTMAVVRYGVESATAISGGTTFTGNYPVMGNSFTIVPAGQLGALTVGDYGSITKTSIKTGETVTLEKITVSAGSNEDAAINQVIVTRVGGSDSTISNVILRKVGSTEVLAGPINFNNKKATFNLATPVSLTKGTSVNLEVVGTVAETTAGTTVTFNVAAGGVVGKGATSGTNVTSTGDSVGTLLTVGNEKLTVTMSSSHPQGSAAYVVKSSNKQDLAKFDVKSTGGDVIVSDIKFLVAIAGGTLTNVGVYDGDSLISDLQSVINGGTPTFSLNYTLPAGTTKTLTVKATTSSVTAGSVNVTFTEMNGSGLASGEAISATTDVTTTSITLQDKGSITASADTTKTPYSQAVLSPSNDVTVAAMKVYAQREDMKLNQIMITATDGAAGAVANETKFTSIRLFADDGVTALTDAITGVNGADVRTFTVTSDDIVSDIVFTKNVYKTILVKANVSGVTTANVSFNVALATDVDLIGQDSGAAADGAAVSFVTTSPYAGGSFSSATKVVTVQKNSGTPSGSISRGSQTVAGIWDVNNYDSTQADAVVTAVTFTSKTGLGSVDQAGAASADKGLFKLYDQDGNLVGTSTAVGANNVVAFTGLTFTVKPGEAKQLKMVVDTTSTAKFASNTQLQFSIEAVADVTVTTGNVGYAAGVWTIPATANVVQLP